jgi:hypothetical protein
MLSAPQDGKKRRCKPNRMSEIEAELEFINDGQLTLF